MRRAIAAVLLSAAVGAGTFVGAAYATDENAPHSGPTSHPHHVHKGNGECEDIDEVLFERDHRGLHQGAGQSGPDRGPWHGTCATHNDH